MPLLTTFLRRFPEGVGLCISGGYAPFLFVLPMRLSGPAANAQVDNFKKGLDILKRRHNTRNTKPPKLR